MKQLLLHNKEAVVPLLATKSKPYKIVINNNYYETWDVFNEAWLVTAIYLGRSGDVARGIRDRYPDVAPDEIDQYIKKVKNDHPLTQIIYNPKNIPLYASDKSYCNLNLPWLYKFPVKLTMEQEKELLEIISGNLGVKKTRLAIWFKKYREKYGLDARLKRDKETQDEQLAEQFCMMHGLDFDRLQEISAKDKKTNAVPTDTNFVSSQLDRDNKMPLFVYGLLYALAIAGVIGTVYGDKQEMGGGDRLVFLIIVATVLSLVIFVPLVIYSGLIRKAKPVTSWKDLFISPQYKLFRKGIIIVLLLAGIYIPYHLYLNRAYEFLPVDMPKFYEVLIDLDIWPHLIIGLFAYFAVFGIIIPYTLRAINIEKITNTQIPVITPIVRVIHLVAASFSLVWIASFLYYLSDWMWESDSLLLTFFSVVPLLGIFLLLGSIWSFLTSKRR